jgi:hypothetical protein
VVGNRPEATLCENCGGTDDDLVAVHRVYLEFDDESVTGTTTVAETELWCRACRATYPNVAPD